MNADIEASLADALTVALVDLEVAPVVRAATSKEPLPTGNQVITAKIDDCPHDAGPYYYALGGVTVKTPVIEGMTVAIHSAAVRAVQTALLAPLDALQTALETRRMKYAGSFPQGPKDNHDDTCWTSRIAIKLGIELLAD